MKLRAGEINRIARAATEEAMLELEDIVAKHPQRFGAPALTDEAADAIEEQLLLAFKQAIEREVSDA